MNTQGTVQDKISKTQQRIPVGCWELCGTLEGTALVPVGVPISQGGVASPKALDTHSAEALLRKRLDCR